VSTAFGDFCNLTVAMDAAAVLFNRLTTFTERVKMTRMDVDHRAILRQRAYVTCVDQSPITVITSIFHKRRPPLMTKAQESDSDWTL